MEIEEFGLADRAASVALWESAGLTRPWNDPYADFDRAIDGATSAVLGHRGPDGLVSTVMVGYDGHRGWLYYLAVADERRRRGLGTALLRSAEAWLRTLGAPKIQLAVRGGQPELVAFYEAAGFRLQDTVLLGRFLD